MHAWEHIRIVSRPPTLTTMRLTSLTKPRVESLFSRSAAATAPPMPPLPILRFAGEWRPAGARSLRIETGKEKKERVGEARRGEVKVGGSGGTEPWDNKWSYRAPPI